ncbi:MAG: nicotinate phosphoribosyltransferase [Erysipelotrichaceae bacterium]|nr:nicotinate phosphoribosyltransferase [Erysipelotrichaceae bacterium]
MEKLIDFYELTMAYTDFRNNKMDEICYFDVFFRKNLNNGGFNIACGLDDIISYIQQLRFNDNDIDYLRSLNCFDDDFLDYLSSFEFKGDIYAVVDGTPIFPNEPIITVIGNAIETQLIETDILNRFNHGCLIATKTRRIINETKKKLVMEFGARRAQGCDAAIQGAKFAYIAGVAGTSCYEAAKRYGMPIMGTMAHSHILKYHNEYDAFMAYAKVFPDNSIFLVDTVDTLRSGIVNAIKVTNDYLIPNGYRLKGIRLDSGDLAYLSKQARIMLDDAGLTDCMITVSNSLDEKSIKDLLEEKAPIDAFGVGERLITSKDDPVFGGVYKLAAMEINGQLIPKIKMSDTEAKLTNPGYKKVYRFYDRKTNYALGDLIALADEIIPENEYVLFDEIENWKQTRITDYRVEELQTLIFKNGELVYDVPSLNQRRAYCEQQLNTLYPEILRINNAHKYYVDLSLKLLDLKKAMIYLNSHTL